MFNNFQNRSHESPMDWEWQTDGPKDPNSPFPQFKRQPGVKKGFETIKPTSSFITNSTPAPPFRNPSFTTPRKPFDQEAFSEVSGAESSPADNADAEDTPETKTSTVMTAFANTSLQKRPLFGRYGANFLGNSPNRAEQRGGRYGNAVATKIVRKRKRIDRDHDLMLSGRRGSISDSEEDAARPRIRNINSNDGKPGWFMNFLIGIESLPNLPHLLSYYTQFTVNLFIAGLTIYGVYIIWITIRADVDKASEAAAAAVLADMAVCARQFTENGCHLKKQLVPALVPVCESWDICMNRDPASVGRAKISAHTFAQIFNSFVEPISYKAMVFIGFIITICLLLNNLAFGTFRPKAPHDMPKGQYFTPHPQTHQNSQWNPPQTPQHSQGGFDMYNTPFQQIMPSQGVQRSPSKEHRSPSKGDRSPSKGSRNPSKGDRDMVLY